MEKRKPTKTEQMIKKASQKDLEGKKVEEKKELTFALVLKHNKYDEITGERVISFYSETLGKAKLNITLDEEQYEKFMQELKTFTLTEEISFKMKIERNQMLIEETEEKTKDG